MISDVCIDKNGGGVWRYDDVARRYFRLQEDNTVSGLIEGRFIPDPEILWRNRCDLNDVAPNSDSGKRLKPQPATFALWEHWKGVSDAHVDA